ncbi:Endonuclease-reverse transcriptase [Popillia japonica]|uniref:Endonuclease-reverse transcriptase n=1 Tax=Popillia japonica TaxID=7064 RepID=A0AAW1M224_POPJA
MSLYTPPVSVAAVYLNLLQTIEWITNHQPNTVLFIVGDFSPPGIKWSTLDKEPIVTAINNIETMVYDNLVYNSLLQYNFNVSRNKLLLDLVLVNSSNISVHEDGYNLAKPDSHHPSLSIDLYIPDLHVIRFPEHLEV